MNVKREEKEMCLYAYVIVWYCYCLGGISKNLEVPKGWEEVAKRLQDNVAQHEQEDYEMGDDGM